MEKNERFDEIWLNDGQLLTCSSSSRRRAFRLIWEWCFWQYDRHPVIYSRALFCYTTRAVENERPDPRASAAKSGGCLHFRRMKMQLVQRRRFRRRKRDHDDHESSRRLAKVNNPSSKPIRLSVIRIFAGYGRWRYDGQRNLVNFDQRSSPKCGRKFSTVSSGGVH